MGYTQYAEQSRDFTKTEWASILIETNKILVAAKVIAPDALRLSSDGGKEALVRTL